MSISPDLLNVFSKLIEIACNFQKKKHLYPLNYVFLDDDFGAPVVQKILTPSPRLSLLLQFHQDCIHCLPKGLQCVKFTCHIVHLILTHRRTVFHLYATQRPWSIIDQILFCMQRRIPQSILRLKYRTLQLIM